MRNHTTNIKHASINQIKNKKKCTNSQSKKTCKPVMASGSSFSSNKTFTYFSFLSTSSTAISYICPFSVPRIISLVEAEIQKHFCDKWKTKCNAIRKHFPNEKPNATQLGSTFGDLLAIPRNGINDEAFETGYWPRSSPLRMGIVRLRTTRVQDGSDAVTAPWISKYTMHRLLATAATR